MNKLLTSSAEPNLGEILPPVIIVVILIALIILSIVNIAKSSKAKKARLSALKADGVTIAGDFFHVNGLPIAEGTFCQLLSYPDRYDFVSGKMKFSLEKEKVTDVCCKTETEIQQQYVSSIGGAVGGAVLFGPIGAMIGGRAKKKTDKTMHLYLIITYMSDNEVKYIGFESKSVSSKINKIVAEFNENRTTTTNVKL